jgi:hypothetical protein
MYEASMTVNVMKIFCLGHEMFVSRTQTLKPMTVSVTGWWCIQARSDLIELKKITQCNILLNKAFSKQFSPSKSCIQFSSFHAQG